MARRSKTNHPETLRLELLRMIVDFEEKLRDSDLREQVKNLVPANYLLRDLGSSLISDEVATSASKRILSYFRKYPKTVIAGDELMVVAGISEYARRIRELRVQMGWPIYSGGSLRGMIEDSDLDEGDNCPHII